MKCQSVVHDGEAVLPNVVFLHVEGLKSKLSQNEKDIFVLTGFYTSLIRDSHKSYSDELYATCV